MWYRISCLIALFLVAVAPACGTRSAQHSNRPPYTAADLAQVINVSEVAIAPGGDEIAYASDSSGVLELWTVSQTKDGWQSRQRTELKERVSSLTYGPNSEIVFCVDHGGNERNDLWLLRRNANTPELIAKTPIAENGPSFSPDGRSLAFIADPKRPFRFNVMVRNMSRGTVRQLTDEPINVIEPRWGRLIQMRLFSATAHPSMTSHACVHRSWFSREKTIRTFPRPRATWWSKRSKSVGSLSSMSCTRTRGMDSLTARTGWTQ